MNLGFSNDYIKQKKKQMFSQKFLGYFVPYVKVSETTESPKIIFKPFSKNQKHLAIQKSVRQQDAKLDSILVLLYNAGRGPSCFLLSGPFSMRKWKSSPLHPHPGADCPQCQRHFLMYLERGGIIFTFPFWKNQYFPIFVDLFPNFRKSRYRPGVEEKFHLSIDMHAYLVWGWILPCKDG